MTATDNQIFVRAPREVVWDITNDVSQWPDLFTEYEAVEVIEFGPPIIFRLTTRPDDTGHRWSWVSERSPDRGRWSVTSRRIEPGPFAHMNLRWDYTAHREGTIMRWRQDFAMKPDAPFSDQQMVDRLNATTAVQMAAVARGVETRYETTRDGRFNVASSDHARRLLILTCGARLSRLVETVVDLRIAEALQEGSLAVNELAQQTGTDVVCLRRVLRALATVDVFEETSPGQFGNTDLSKFLLEEHPYSLAPLVQHSASRMITQPYEHLTEAVRSGSCPAQQALSADVWSFLEGHTDDAEAFDASMTRLGAWEVDRHVAAMEPERFTQIIDVGGGRGLFLAALLRAAPRACGVLVDQDRVLREAEGLLAEQGVGDRVRLQAEDAFSMAPWPCQPQRAVVLKAVLHNWSDERAERALITAAASIDETGRVFLVEQVVAPGNRFDHAKWLDIDMMLTFDGRERTEDDWSRLLERAGLEMTHTPLAGRWGVIECRNART